MTLLQLSEWKKRRCEWKKEMVGAGGREVDLEYG